ncbi:MAG: RidA family protein [bacterium]
MATPASPFQIIQPKGMYTTPNYVHALRAGNTLYVAGQVARDEHGNLVGEGDVAAQARQVYRNIGTVLAAAGADWRHIVKVTTYLLDRADSPAVTAVRHEHFGDHRPPHTGLIVAGLGSPGVRLEVDVIAVLPSGAKQRRRADRTRDRRARRATSRRSARR